MEIFPVVLLVLYLVSTLPVHVVAENAVDASTASTLIKEGQSAEILCMTKGTGDYFWRKGESLLNSSLVASFTGGQVRKDAEPYVVTEIGTLIIKIVTLEDEGKYFCRVSSVINECYGELNVFVEASLRSFVLAIDRCDRESSCLLYISPSHSTSLTCAATNAPPSMTLKWFNGSKEITEGIEVYDIPTQNDNAREIRSTLTAVYGHPASLTCQTVDPKRGNNDDRFAHAQVEMPVHAHETLPIWMIVTVTLVGCFIVFGIFLLIKAKVNRKQREKYTKLKKEDDESLTTKVKTNEDLINAKHQKLTEFKVSAESKDREISDLKETIKDKDNTISELRRKDVENKSAITSSHAIDKVKATASQAEMEKKENELSVLKNEVHSREKEISTLQEDVKTKDKKISELETSTKFKDKEINDKLQEIVQMKENIKDKDKTISELREKDVENKSAIKNSFVIDKVKATASQAEMEKKENELSVLKREIKNKDKAILALQVNVKTNNNAISGLKELAHRGDKAILELKTNLQRKEIDIKEQSDQILKLKGNLTQKDDALREITIKLEKSKAILKEKNVELWNTSKELADLKGAQQRSQNKLRKKHQGNDGD